MQIKISTLKKILMFGLIAISLIGFIIFLLAQKPSASESGFSVITNDGDTQILNLVAKGGYTPNEIIAQADTETILKVSTNNTFDCSSALTIPELNFSKYLPATGITEIKISPQQPGSEIVGSCSMGMYGFKIKFIE